MATLWVIMVAFLSWTFNLNMLYCNNVFIFCLFLTFIESRIFFGIDGVQIFQISGLKLLYIIRCLTILKETATRNA